MKREGTVLEFVYLSGDLRTAFDGMFVRYFMDDLGADETEAVIRTRNCPFLIASWERA